MKTLGKNTASVRIGELGTNCWKSERFIDGHRCERVLECKYPEKKICKAVPAEIAFLEKQKKNNIDAIDEKIAQLRSKTG